MLPVSLQWQQSIRQPIRNAAFLKVSFAVIAPGARNNAVATADSTLPTTAPQDILNGNEDYTKIASWEPSRWADDGSFVLPEETTVMEDAGWWSNLPLASDPVTVTFTFPRNFKCSNIQIHWDLVTKSYATKFDIVAYDKFGAEIERVAVTNNTDLVSNTEGHFDEFWKLEIIIKQWSIPGWRARIYNVIFGFYKEFLDHEILGATQTSKESAMLTSLPTFEFKLDVNNYDRWFNPEAAMGLSNYVQNYQHIFVTWGFELTDGTVEWLRCGNYFLNAWQTDKSTFKATLTGQSLLLFMTAEYTEGVYDGNPHTVYDLAKSVFDFSGVQQYMDDPCYILSQTLKQYTTDIPLPRLPCNQLLQLLAQMAGCILKVDNDTGAITFEKTLYTLVYNDITGHCESTNPIISLDPILKNVLVAFYRPQPDVDDTSVFEENVTVTNELVLNIMTDAPYVNHTVALSAPEADSGTTSENILPDTNTWVMSNGQTPTVSGGYDFEATFTGAWEAFTCNFSADLMNSIKGKTITFGVASLTGASSRLELIVDGNFAGGITQTSTPASAQYTIPATASGAYLRIVVFSADDLHCAFSDVYMTYQEASPDYLNMTAQIIESKAYKFALKITGTGTAKVTVNAREIIISELQHEAYNNENVVSGKTLTVTNQLVANLANADELGKFAASLFKHRQRIAFDYNGDPSITPMDIYRVQTHFGWVPTLITSATLKYNGAWTGSLEGMQTTPHDDFPGRNLFTGTFEAGDDRDVQIMARREK